MAQNFDLPGPGTGMAIAAGLAAYGAGVGDLQHELPVLLTFVGATILIEGLHLSAPVVRWFLNDD